MVPLQAAGRRKHYPHKMPHAWHSMTKSMKPPLWLDQRESLLGQKPPHLCQPSGKPHPHSTAPTPTAPAA